MKKPPAHKNSSSALTPLAQSLPALVPIELTEEEIEAIKETHKGNLAKADRKGGLRFNRFLGYFNGGGLVLGLAVGTATGFGTVLTAVALACSVTSGSGSQAQRYKNFNKAQKDTQDYMRGVLEEAQRDTYATQKQLIVEAAEQHIRAGKFMTEADAAWLGNLNTEDIADASDELAVTVLQIRQLLAYARDQQEEALRVKPATFATLQLTPEFGANRGYLREKLLATDQHIAEDDYPLIQAPEFTPVPEMKPGTLRLIKEYMLPFTDTQLRRAFKEAAPPAVPEVNISNVVAVADFAEALEAFESKYAPLDLPAVRGWKGGMRRAITGPKTF